MQTGSAAEPTVASARGLELEAQAFADEGDYAAAVAALSAANRIARQAKWERLLANWRYLAYAQQPPTGKQTGSWPAQQAQAFADAAGVPEIAAGQLNAASLAMGMQRHGALLVRGLLDSANALALAEGIRKAFDAQARWLQHGDQGEASPWYCRLEMPEDCEVTEARPWVESAGGVWLADSPRMLFDYAELLPASPVLDAITGYFGERPMLSVGKTTLRCVPHTIRLSDWHQDGAFMGTAIRSVNLWLSLSHCGEDASGLDYLPKRLDRVLESGTHGANFNWSVGPGLVDIVAENSAIASPVFAPGDALLFDHYLLHRTGIPAKIAKDRYAIESWFFAPSAYPAQQVPFYL